MSNEKKKNTTQFKCSCGLEHLWNFDPNINSNDIRTRTCKCGKIIVLTNESNIVAQTNVFTLEEFTY